MIVAVLSSILFALLLPFIKLTTFNQLARLTAFLPLGLFSYFIQFIPTLRNGESYFLPKIGFLHWV